MNAGFVRKAMTFAAFGLALSVTSLGTFINAAAQQPPMRPRIGTNDPATYRYAYQHGYNNGYEDGYTKGKSDFTESQPRDFSTSDAFNRAERGYTPRMGTKAEFEEAYRAGFEIGYNDGFFGRELNSALPKNLRSVVIATVNANSAPPEPPANQGPSRPRNGDSDRDRDVGRDNGRDNRDRDNGPG